MAYQSTIEFTSCRQVPMMPQFKHKTVPNARNLSALVEELSLMDTAIPLTLIPDMNDDVDQDMPVWNIFDQGEIAAPSAPKAPVAPRRVSRRSRAQQGRLVALRRHATLALLRKSTYARRVWRASSKTELRTLRACIYEKHAPEAAMSLPLRLATHTMSMALIVTAWPAGVALLCYNLLKGEDMRATARMTTLSGMALTVMAGNPWLAAIAGI
jgi:hypothetical protein